MIFKSKIKLFMLINLVTKGFVNISSSIRKVLICPDKYKFSLSSSEVSAIIKESLPNSI